MNALYECRKVIDACVVREWNLGATTLSIVLRLDEYYATMDDLHVPSHHPDRVVRASGERR